jgi:hypothetical protein
VDSPLQKSPSGILGALELKVLGANPAKFGEVLVPIIDAYDQYLADTLLPKTIGPTAAAAGNNQFTQLFTPPAGHAWRLIAAGGYFVADPADAAVVASGSVILRAPSGPLTNPFLYATTLPQIPTFARQFGVTFAHPIYVPPGWSVQTQVQCSAALTVDGFHTGTLLVQEFDS